MKLRLSLGSARGLPTHAWSAKRRRGGRGARGERSGLNQLRQRGRVGFPWGRSLSLGLQLEQVVQVGARSSCAWAWVLLRPKCGPSVEVPLQDCALFLALQRVQVLLRVLDEAGYHVGGLLAEARGHALHGRLVPGASGLLG